MPACGSPFVIGDAAGDHTAARKREVDPIERLSLE